jgi:hypothetical protein
MSCSALSTPKRVLLCRFSNNQHTLEELLSIRNVIGPPGASEKAFLESCVKPLVYVLLRHKRTHEVYAVRTILGALSQY